jgi:hypothetical protein
MNLSLIKSSVAALAAIFVSTTFVSKTSAQMVYPAYRIEYRTVYERQPFTTYRLQQETVMQARQVTTHKPIWESETRVRRVAKPVLNTETRVQQVTVRKPVMDTETRTQQRVVRRPITEQVMQNRTYVTKEPVTTMHTQYVDQGQYVDQYVLEQGNVRNRLQWLPGGYVPNPATGTMVYQRSGFHWVPTQSPGRYQVQRQYVPNVVAQEVPVTTYQDRVVNEQVPVNVTRYQDEVVNEQYQVQVCKYVDEVVNRPYQVTTQSVVYEDQPYEVKVCKWVAETSTVQVPHTVSKWVAETGTRLVPRTVTMRVPIQTCSPCTTAYYPSSAYYYSQPAPVVGAADAPPQLGRSEVARPTEAKKEATGDDATNAKPAEAADEKPELEKNPMDAVVPNPTAIEPQPAAKDDHDDLMA